MCMSCASSTQVSVTPLSLDLTSRVDLDELERLLRNGVVR